MSSWARTSPSGLGPERLDHLVAHEIVEIGQGLGVETGAERRDQVDALGRLETLDEVGEVSRMQWLGEGGGEERVVVRERVPDLGDEGVGELERNGPRFIHAARPAAWR